jgi:hypothetical protein
VDERAAEAEATRCNDELGQRGVSDAFYIAVADGGEWRVELRRDPPDKPSWRSRVMDVIAQLPWP